MENDTSLLWVPEAVLALSSLSYYTPLKSIVFSLETSPLVAGPQRTSGIHGQHLPGKLTFGIDLIALVKG